MATSRCLSAKRNMCGMGAHRASRYPAIVVRRLTLYAHRCRFRVADEPGRSLVDRPGSSVEPDQARSNRSSSMTLVQAATKSATNLSRASWLA
jgi:hypothetical protein